MSSGAIRSMLILMALSIVAIFAIGFLVNWWLGLAIWGGSMIIGACIIKYSVWSLGSHNNGYLPDVSDIEGDD